MNLIPIPLAIVLIGGLLLAAGLILRRVFHCPRFDEQQAISDDEKDRQMVAERITRAADREIAHRKRKAYPLTESKS